MKPAEDIKQYFRKSTLSTNPDRHEAIFERIVRAQDRSGTIEPALNRLSFRSIIMKNPLTKLATAAIVAIACLIGLSLWRGTESGIALADVLAQIEKVKAYSYQWSAWETGEYGGEPIKSKPRTSTTLRSQYGGKVERLDPNGGVDTLIYCSIQDKAIFSVWPKQKKYSRMDFDDAEQLTSMVQSQYDYFTRGMVKDILGCKYESMGRSTIDGIEVEGFRTTDPNFVSQDKQRKPGQVDVRIWVDVKTRLPVRSEEHIPSGKSTWHFTTHDYRWDIPVDASEFKPVIPDDYTLLAGEAVKWPAITEETAIQGLKQCVEFLGKYLEAINLTSLYSALERSGTPAALRLKEELKSLVGPGKDQKRMDTLKPMFILNMFYVGLDGKDPAYYGKTVTPKDADKVLMRWKLSDSEYRVIFGDLHAETVTKEKLSELEAALPK
jgi:outer membrane lipoprotein-sorting protein